MIAFLFGLTLSAFAEGSDDTVHVHGRLMDIMHQGKIDTVVSLDSYADKKHVYGLGAVSKLDGEILVLDSKVYVSRERGGQTLVTVEPEVDATLFVASSVKNWHKIKIPSTVQSSEQLDQFIQEQVKKHNLPVDGPLPFQITGTFDTLGWHVIHWPIGDTEHTHKKHVTSGAHGTSNEVTGTIVGFYSTKHTGIFTHHTTNLHMHFLQSDKQLMGHVDAVELGDGMVLRLQKL